MTLRYFVFLLSSLIAFGVSGDQPSSAKKLAKPPTKAVLDKDLELEKCQDPSKLKGLCGSVSGMIEDSDPDSFYVYDYQRRVYEASCVDYENDTKEEIS